MSPSTPLTITLPAASPNQTYVTVSALDAGHLTLPERLFVTDADPEKRSTVPSMSFLIQHHSTNSSKAANILFDLGLKRDFSGYRTAQQEHISQRQPTTVSPDAAESLRNGGLDPKDIDIVILSHVHWDHVGTPADFPNATFIVGSRTLHLLAHGGGPLYPAELFNADELPLDRTQELPPVEPSDAVYASPQQTPSSLQWQPLAGFPAVIDFFGDGTVYVVDAPGHLYGHVNLLCRIGEGKWVYLGGDCCHDPRILTGEKGIAEYEDGKGGVRSVHADTNEAARTVERVWRLMGAKDKIKEDVREGEGRTRDAHVEVVVAHDKVWMEGNRMRFFPGRL